VAPAPPPRPPTPPAPPPPPPPCQDLCDGANPGEPCYYEGGCGLEGALGCGALGEEQVRTTTKRQKKEEEEEEKTLALKRLT